MTRHLRRRKQPWSREQAVLIRKMARIAEFAIAVATRSIAPDKRGEFKEDQEFIGLMIQEANESLLDRRVA